MNLDWHASDGSCLHTNHAALSAQWLSAICHLTASTQLQLGLGIPLSTSPSDLANQVRQVTHGLAVLLVLLPMPTRLCGGNVLSLGYEAEGLLRSRSCGVS